ncbi:MAG: hypothetical protein AB7S80_01220 [Rhizobiaceae bacterium]
MERTSRIIVAYLQANTISLEQLPALIAAVGNTLMELSHDVDRSATDPDVAAPRVFELGGNVIDLEQARLALARQPVWHRRRPVVRRRTGGRD